MDHHCLLQVSGVTQFVITAIKEDLWATDYYETIQNWFFDESCRYLLKLGKLKLTFPKTQFIVTAIKADRPKIYIWLWNYSKLMVQWKLQIFVKVWKITIYIYILLS